jgi:hypothetical protein
METILFDIRKESCVELHNTIKNSDIFKKDIEKVSNKFDFLDDLSFKELKKYLMVSYILIKAMDKE